jgi:hypothetical protein
MLNVFVEEQLEGQHMHIGTKTLFMGKIHSRNTNSPSSSESEAAKMARNG